MSYSSVADTLLFTFEENTIPNRTKIAVAVSTALFILFQNSIILIHCFVLLHGNGVVYNRYWVRL